MNITLKENLILNNIIGNYIMSNSLYYDECKSLYKIVNNLKEARHDIKVPYKILLDKTPLTKDVINDIESNELKEARKVILGLLTHVSGYDKYDSRETDEAVLNALEWLKNNQS